MCDKRNGVADASVFTVQYTIQAFVSQALVLGDKRPFISALITLDEEALRPWLESKGLNRDMSMEEASSNMTVRAEVQKWVDQANEGVSRAESVRKFIILPEEFTQENGLMTASMKVIPSEGDQALRHLLNTQMYTKKKWLGNSKQGISLPRKRRRALCSREKSEAQLLKLWLSRQTNGQWADRRRSERLRREAGPKRLRSPASQAA